MSRVNDKTLKDAVGHLQLRCFRLMSYSCILLKDEYDYLLSPYLDRFNGVPYSEEEIFSNNISLDGIRALNTGVFAESIEQLDLDGLKIDNVPDEDKCELQKEFRSWHF